MSLEKLLKGLIKEKPKAQAELYTLYSRTLFGVSLKYSRNYEEAEDNLQDAFLTIFKKIQQYKGKGSFEGWLKRIVINKSIDMLKAKKLELVAINEQVLGTVDEHNDWSVDDGITLDQIKEAIEELPERYRYAVMLFLVEGYDHQEISEILEITEVASRTLVHRGKKKLQEKLKTKYHGTGY